MPWTMHLKGLSSLFASHWELRPRQRLDPLLIHVIEVLSLMDMPTFVVGRQSPCLDLWKTYRLNRPPDEERMYDDADIEETCGIPRSLLDLICNIENINTKQQLWHWKGHAGNVQQCHLWEAYRFAAILRAEGSQWVDHLSSSTGEASELAMCRLMASLDALFAGLDLPQYHHLLIWNSVLYPLFVARVASIVSPNFGRWGLQAHDWFETLASKQHMGNARTVKAFLGTFKARFESENLTVLDLESMATEDGKELTLL